MPASPWTTATWGRLRTAARKRSTRAANSSSRPTSAPSRSPRAGGDASARRIGRSRRESARTRSASAAVRGSGRTPSSRSSTAQQASYAARAPVRSPTAARNPINRRWARSSSGFSPSQRMTVSIPPVLSPESACNRDSPSSTVAIRSRHSSRWRPTQSSKSGASGRENPSRKSPRHASAPCWNWATAARRWFPSGHTPPEMAPAKSAADRRRSRSSSWSESASKPTASRPTSRCASPPASRSTSRSLANVLRMVARPASPWLSGQKKSARASLRRGPPSTTR
jgi:hypothetical protein